MSVADIRSKLPRLAVPVTVGLLVLTLLYSVLVTANLLLWFAAWGGLFGLGAVLYVIHLFYRLVVAVERIADGQ